LVEAAGCRAEALSDLDRMRALMGRIVAELGLTVIGAPQWHQFPGPAGVTGLYLLGESHLACHTFPEVGVATFNLYSCRPRPPWPWQDRLAGALGARTVNVRSVPR
jgi:S-adenosylmethionine decarboxylase